MMRVPPGRSSSFGKALVLLVFSACAGDPNGREGDGSSLVPTVEDSSGVRIVEYSRVPLGGPTWEVIPEPRVLVGDSSDTEAVLVNPLAALGTADGGMVIRDSSRGFFSLKYFDPTGRLIATTADWGQGPFEFRFPLGVHRLQPDSVLVVGEDGRYAVFGPFGARVREGRAASLASPQAVLSHHAGRGLVIVANSRPSLGSDGRRQFGLTRWQRDFMTISLWDDVPERRLASAPGTPSWNREMSGRPNGVWTHTYPFRPLTSAGAANGRFWLAVADRPEVRGYDPVRGLELLVRFSGVAEDVTWWDRRAFKKSVEEHGTGSNEERWADYLREVEFPDTKPYFGRIEVARNGDLWLQHYQFGPGDQLWSVFDPSGDWIANVKLPAELVSRCEWNPRRYPCDRIHEIGQDHILVETEGAFGVRMLGRYRIER